MSELRTPELGELLDLASLTVYAERGHTMPGVVQSYNASTQRALVKPALPIARGDIDGDGELDFDALPVIEVPVVWLRVAGWALHMPIAAGDGVLLIICARSLDTWIESGELDQAPADLRIAALQDAVAIPGLFAAPGALTAAQTLPDEVVLSSSSGATRLRLSASKVIVEAGEVVLGAAAATTALARADRVDTNLSEIETALTAVNLQLVALGQAGIAPPYVKTSTAADKVKGQ